MEKSRRRDNTKTAPERRPTFVTLRKFATAAAGSGQRRWHPVLKSQRIDGSERKMRIG
jgi:hypothetical protein